MKVIDKIKEHCLKGIEEELKTRMLPEHSYNMGYHDMASEILEIIEEITEEELALNFDLAKFVEGVYEFKDGK